jgi:hypothetical protein
MELTRQQQESVHQARERGDSRVTVDFTPEQQVQWRKSAQEELAGKGENVVHHRKIIDAAEQSGFLGDIRRAMMATRRPLAEIAASIGIDQQLLSDFRSAEADLPTDALERLVGTLGLRLMQEIPRP